MKKKLLSLLLAVLMLMSIMLTSCSNEEDDGTVTLNADSTNTRTVVIAAITGETTTPEAITQVEEALNRVSKSMYKTQVVLRLMTEDEYEDYINDTYTALKEEEEAAEKAEQEARKEALEQQRQQALEDAKKKVRTKWVKDDEEDEAETSETQATATDEYGRVVLQYPDAGENQIDIVFMTGVDMFYRFFDKDYLMPITSTIASESQAEKDLSKYIYPTFMAAGRIDRTQYAIPSNQPLGYYTYFLVNKELADRYQFTVGETITLNDCEAFLDSVHANEPGVTPINMVPDMKGLYYLTGEDSPIGSIVSDTYQPTADAKPTNLYENSEYVAFRALKEKLINGGYVDENATDPAIKVVRAFDTTPEDEGWSNEYYVALHSTPRASNETVYSGLFGISSYSANPDRAFEIINLLNTDTTFRNTYQYGVKDVNYTLNDDNTVHMLNDDYSMDLFQTGNVYMAYVPKDMPANSWEKSKEQNLTTYVEPFFHVSTQVLSDTNADLAENMEKYSEMVERQNQTISSSADPAASLQNISPSDSYFLNNMLSSDSDSICSFYYDYFGAQEDLSTGTLPG